MVKPNSVKIIFPFIRFAPAKFGCSVYTTWANDEGPKNLGVLNCVIRPLGREGIDPKSYLYHAKFGRYGSNFVGMSRGSQKFGSAGTVWPTSWIGTWLNPFGGSKYN